MKLPAYAPIFSLLTLLGCGSTDVQQAANNDVSLVPHTSPPPAENNNVEPVKPRGSKPLITDKHPNKFENVASKIKVISVKFDSSPPPENASQGTWVHITWKNGADRPVREINADISVTEDEGNVISGAPTPIWLYADSNPILPGETHVTHDFVGTDEPRGLNGKVTVITATEGLHEL